MNQILIITAHPSSKNLTKAIANIYQTEKEKKGDKVEIIDLYADKQMSFLAFETHHDLTKKDEVRDYHQTKMKQADKNVDKIFKSIKKKHNNSCIKIS